MSRMEKSTQILELAVMMQNSLYGVSLEDIMTKFEISKRTAQRMKGVIEDTFVFELEEVNDLTSRKKRWRLKKGAVNSLIGFSLKEICTLERITDNLNNETDKRVLKVLTEKLKIQTKKD